MKILVAMVPVPDTTSKIEFINDNTAFKKEGITFIINPYDECALARAIELKEATSGTVTVITVGEADNDPIIRKALSLNIDNAVRINTIPKDAYSVANSIAEYVRNNEFDLILLGKESISDNGGQIGGMLAALLDLPFISEATALNVTEKEITCKTAGVGGTELTLITHLPAIVSASEGMAQPKIANMRGIMSAKTKPLAVIEGEQENYLQTIAYELPPPRSECKLFTIDEIDELVEVLRNKEKVI